MNALTPINDLLPEAFKCSGSINSTSPAWKSQAIGNIEARLAVAWTAARATEKSGPMDYPLKDNSDAIAARAEIDADVFAAIPDAPTLDDLEVALEYPRAHIQNSLQRLRTVGKIMSRKTCDGNTYAQAIGTPLDAQDGVSATHVAESEDDRSTGLKLGARAAAMAKAKQARETRAKVEELYRLGCSGRHIAEQLKMNRRYVLGVMREIVAGAK